MLSIALVLAVALNATAVKLKFLFRISYFLPAITGLVAYSIVFMIMLND